MCRVRWDPGGVFPDYEIRVICRGDGRPGEVFGDLTVSTDGGVVLVRGRLDQSALHGVLERIRARRWQVVDVRRARSTPRHGRTGG